MGMLSEVIKEGPRGIGHRCDVCEWLVTLDDETREEAQSMIADRGWGGTSLVEEHFAPLGLMTSPSVLEAHRKALARG